MGFVGAIGAIRA